MLLPADDYLIRRDLDLVGLRLLLDTDALATTLLAQFPHLNLNQVKKTYIRYKPATSCIVSYELTIAQKTVLAYAKAVTNQDKLEKYVQRPGVIQDCGIGRTVFKPERVIFSLLPNDNKMKQLTKLFDVQSREQTLQKLLPDHDDLSSLTLKTLRYKPERRYVAQLSIPTKPEAIVKAYSHREYPQAEINAHAFKSIAPLHILPELGHSKGDRLLAFPWIMGLTLADLMTIAPDNTEQFILTGTALGLLHQQDPKNLKPLSRGDEAKHLLLLASDLTWLCPQWKHRIQNIAVELSIAILNAPIIHRPIHGDFNGEQVLLSNRNDITFIDFDCAMGGDPAMDLGSFIAKLIRDELQGVLSTKQCEKLAMALVAGYRTTAPEVISDDQIQLYTAVGLFRLVAEPFRHCECNWLEKIDIILSRIEQITNIFKP
ncbi:MAG: phosphotransferase family protein [Cyanobacterium sp.]